MNFRLKEKSNETFSCPSSQKRRSKLWRRIVSAALCVILMDTSIGGTLTAMAATDEMPVILEHVEYTNRSEVADADTQTEGDTPSDADSQEGADASSGSGNSEEGATSPEANTEGETTAPSDADAQEGSDASGDVGNPEENTASSETSTEEETTTPSGEGAQEEPDAAADPDHSKEDTTSSETNTEEETTTMNEEGESEEQTEEGKEVVYTLYLTHYFQFSINGEDRSVSAEEKIELTEADFEDGVCDLNRFAYDAPQFFVTEQKTFSQDAFNEAHEGSAQIVYAVGSGWQIVSAADIGDAAGEESIVLREVFNGELSDYVFIPENGIQTNADKDSEEAVYTLYLTHYFRFKVNGQGRNVSAKEKIELTEADFEDGVCDLNRFAYDVQQLTVTEAKPLSLDAFDEEGMGGARIVYAVNSGWRVVPVDDTGDNAGKGSTVLREVFNGELSDYEFVPANIIRMNVEYKYSSTGGLAGVDAASASIVEALPVKNDDGDYELECALPVVTGFRIVMDPTPLNKYLVAPPSGQETQEELLAALERGDFSVDVVNEIVYYYQEQSGQQINPVYGNIYSMDYNRAWNSARTLVVAGDAGYTAAAVCGADYVETAEGHGANVLEDPRLKVTLTEKQLDNAMENGLNITVNYRRNATWYTVNHWVPKELSGLSADEMVGRETREENGVEYILRDTEEKQGRVGGLTNATEKTGGVYELLSPLGIFQKLIEGTTSIAESGFAATGTTVDIYYGPADYYRVIFDTDYTYIPRQQIALGESVDFSDMAVPERKGYEFDGWRYLRKDAQLNENGEYGDEAYERVETDANGNYTLKLDSELISQKAKIQETIGVQALHLYPIWKPVQTQVTVVLWMEDLTGVDDVQAVVEEGESEYYEGKYEDYKYEPETHKPTSGSSNSNYSNVGSFTINVATDSSLVMQDDQEALLESIQTEVTRNFATAVGDVNGFDASQFYTQEMFEILQEGGNSVDSTATASHDGKTMIYVYFTRKVYTLKFHYYGEAATVATYPLGSYKQGDYVTSNYCVANNTNGFSYAGTDKFINGDVLNFYYTDSASNEGTWHRNTYLATDITSAKDMPVPQTITIKAKYGADLRGVWPAARPEEHIDNTTGSWGGKDADMISWATTAGKYREEAMTAGNSHFNEPTIMGLYATMDSEIVADPAHPETVHHLVAYWSERNVSYYRYNHCFEVPGLKIDSTVQTIRLNGDSTKLEDTLYLVPRNNASFTKYQFTDLMKVSYEDGRITYNAQDGQYYAVRGYAVGNETKYYAVARQVDTMSTNSIEKQNPSARAHMTKVNSKADHTTLYKDDVGSYLSPCGEKDDPYDLYFYYDRVRYTIKYMATNAKAFDDNTQVELGHINLPYGAYVTEDLYAFKLDYRDTNQAKDEEGKPKYRWTYPDGAAVAVCPDRSEQAPEVVWKFKGWGLGPAGVNMQWKMKDPTDPVTPQGQAESNFYIGSDLLLYAIWDTPSHTVTFHLNGGMVGKDNSIQVKIPANTRFTASGTIPRPLRDGYKLKGWYKADENGNATTEKFNFDSVIISDQHVAAVWEATNTEKYSYEVYYVTKTLQDDDKGSITDTVQIDTENDTIVKTGGETYYVLSKDEQKNQLYVSNVVLNLRAKMQPGYVPAQTNKALVLTDAGKTYNVIFYYTPQTNDSHMVRFVEAGTETKSDPTVVKTVQVEADQTVVTPDAAAVKELIRKGYELVNKGADGTYTAVTEYLDLTWLDEQGNIQKINTLTGNKIPDTVTYLVQPIVYAITYKNADNSPAAANNALAAVTAAENTPANNVQGKNPTLYTAKDTFELKNPNRVYENGKWYQFSHWSLGDNTTVNTATRSGESYSTLQVDKGTVGDLAFVANWKELTALGSLTVSNTVSGNQGDTGREFTFTVTLNDTSIEGKYGEMTFHAGVATFKLRHGESVTAQDLPAGIRYKVEESGNAGYKVTSSGESGMIEEGKEAIALFDNHKSGDNSGEDKPTDPVDPTDPAKPTEPTDPVDPAKPTDPTDPNGPTEPTKPATPAEPAKPTTSMELTKSAALVEASDSSSSIDASPRTGDETNLPLWLALLGISGIGIIASGRRYRGKRYKR